LYQVTLLPERRAITNGLSAMRVGATRAGLAALRDGISTDGLVVIIYYQLIYTRGGSSQLEFKVQIFEKPTCRSLLSSSEFLSTYVSKEPKRQLIKHRLSFFDLTTFHSSYSDFYREHALGGRIGRSPYLTGSIHRVYVYFRVIM
jgi:hypothetical protein